MENKESEHLIFRDVDHSVFYETGIIMICNCKRLDGLFSVVHIICHCQSSSDDHNCFEFHNEESECPTEFSEETVLISATASECATANASVTMATSRPTRTLAKKANCSIAFGIFFRF